MLQLLLVAGAHANYCCYEEDDDEDDDEPVEGVSWSRSRLALATSHNKLAVNTLLLEQSQRTDRQGARLPALHCFRRLVDYVRRRQCLRCRSIRFGGRFRLRGGPLSCSGRLGTAASRTPEPNATRAAIAA